MSSRATGALKALLSNKLKTTRLSVEQLESRWMNAADLAESGLGMDGASPSSSEFESELSGGGFGDFASTNPVNQPPTIARALALTGGNLVTGRAVSASILGADDAGASLLTYHWTVLESPSDAGIAFSRNGTNDARSNRLTFTRAGDYEIQVTIVDQGQLSVTTSLRFTVQHTLTKMRITTPENRIVYNGNTLSTTSPISSFRAVGLDQFGMAMPEIPSTWDLVTGPEGGAMESNTNSGLSSLTFNRAGTFAVKATLGHLTSQFNVRINQVPTSLSIHTEDGSPVSETIPIEVIRRSATLDVRFLDQFGDRLLTMPRSAWKTVVAPPSGVATLSMSGAAATLDFSRVGAYELLFSGGGKSRTVKANVKSTLSKLELTPNIATVTAGETQQFQVQGFDQYGTALSTVGVIAWTATGGTVDSNGLFTAGSVAGVGSVRATSGSVSATAAITIVASNNNDNGGPSFQTPALAQLIQSLYIDQSITRTEMMQILRSTGSDLVVDSAELSDLRTLVTSTYYAMPKYVRGLASDVVNSNPANLRYQGQAAGNLVAGSPATLLNNLIDKWYLGADVPAVTSSGVTYVTSTGTLFANTPSLNDARQGMVGDCYLIASLVSIAHKNPQAIRDLFLDNNDGTYTVRFFKAGVADWVTVNRQLPVNSSNSLYYAGMGLSALNSSTTLWLALAEKAYAQWNETGNSGRNGTNTYSGIESGWMHNVNAQVLGYSSTNYSFSSSTQQTLVSALQNGLAVTAGTKSTVAAGLVSGHAYTVVSYNSTNGTFVLDNPWGFQDPSPLTWAQLQASFTIFTTTDPTGSSGDSGGGFGTNVLAAGAPSPEVVLERGNVVANAIDRTRELAHNASDSDGISLNTGLGSQTEQHFAGTDYELLGNAGENLDDASGENESGAEDRILVEFAMIELYIDTALS